MSSNFPFLPRKVARPGVGSGRQKEAPNATPVAHVPSASGSVTKSLEPTQIARTSSSYNAKGKGKEIHNGPSDEDCAVAIVLSLSDYAIWVNPDLRRMMESHAEGFVPLSYILNHSSYLTSVTPSPAEVQLSKAIRSQQFTSELFEIRMLVSTPSRGNWQKKEAKNVRDAVGGYEIRRKDWEDALRRIRKMNRTQWDARSIYMENIPVQYRAIPGIVHFTTALLSSSRLASEDSIAHTPVEHVTLPPHHLDKLGEPPKCKGFALITLGSQADADVLLTHWPWDAPEKPDALGPEEESTEYCEAVKFELRTLSKRRWEELNEGYLACRQKLLDDAAVAGRPSTEHEADGDFDFKPIMERTSAKGGTEKFTRMAEISSALSTASTMSPSSYPISCLVFVRNVHPSTNKTTLRTLFSRAFECSSEEGNLPKSDGLDYIDFNKGMDSCYLRLATPDHAQCLITYFASHSTIQSEGLDGTGTLLEGEISGRPIAMELITGKKEEVYWEKVPEKVRKQAVERAVKFTKPMDAEETTREENREEGRRRKRRRKK